MEDKWNGTEVIIHLSCDKKMRRKVRSLMLCHWHRTRWGRVHACDHSPRRGCSELRHLLHQHQCGPTFREALDNGQGYLWASFLDGIMRHPRTYNLSKKFIGFSAAEFIYFCLGFGYDSLLVFILLAYISLVKGS